MTASVVSCRWYGKGCFVVHEEIKEERQKEEEEEEEVGGKNWMIEARGGLIGGYVCGQLYLCYCLCSAASGAYPWCLFFPSHTTAIL